MRSFLLSIALIATSAHGQWLMQDSGTTASLRGIDNVGGGVAWASGTSGTVLKTEDGGKHWQACAVPPDAETLDFRGVQAFDAKTAIVMSSGKGEMSRLYKTTDGCATWKLVFTNPDKDGFWDSLKYQRAISPPRSAGVLVGDPVDGKFTVFLSSDEGNSWSRWSNGVNAGGTKCKVKETSARSGEALFAASNSSLFEWWGIHFMFVTGGKEGARLIYSDASDFDGMLPCRVKLSTVDLPLAMSDSAGAFSFVSKDPSSYFPIEAMVVGGDYRSPDATANNAIFISTKSGASLPHQSIFKVTSPITPPHGYRSAVAYDATSKAWITVGPNGTDVSFDDGKNWKPLTPSTGDAPDADKNWNALSLPFVVGPKGRIGVLESSVWKAAK